MMTDIQLLYIDLFCGAGGTSTGVESARHDGRKCAKVIACVNHDANAIASHATNHPDAVHFTEDIRTLNLEPMVMHLERMKKRYPEAHVVLWASLECTNFSKAKGGQPRDADSRTLAEHLFRYIEALKPDYIQIENVEEFMCWGDLDENGKPVSRDKGRCYVRWVNTVRDYGYDYDWRILNAADYGAYTSRRRFFGQFARKGLPIAFPVQTHAKMPDNLYPNKDNPKGFYPTPDWHELFPGFYLPWKPVREVLDLQDEGTSIFGKKKPLCEKTLERIYAGLVKFVAGGKKQHEAFLMRYNSVRPVDTVKTLDNPCGVLTTENRFGIVKVNFLSKQFSGDPMGKNQGIDRPAGTITCKDHHAFVTAYFGNGYNTSIDEPNPTVTTKERHALVVADGIDLDKPMPDVPLDQVRVMTRRFLDSQYGNGTPSSVDSAAPTIVNNPKQSVVSADQFLANPFSYKSDGNSIDSPCFTLIARMDKMPPYLVTTEHGDLGIAIYETDSPMTRKVKEFMAMYGIIDVKMRMLNIRELKRIMGFPEDYTLVGTQAEQKKYIGNAVEVNMARVLCEALCEELSNK